ncbi:MAG: hypothetical protein NZ473_00355 [Candidatus Kapabacteria bacterium]|nr:hypothetical protein [Candidatus Kapabacteria bacterium]MCS7170091.1 hypothetical protein [Candidatus Kapabacteria bacterium]MDW7996580.1 hypothetical protein [Bacteroidota bacterium]MDW8225521.1 hypothetical protein [Bacteroidota bacterium]
MHWCVAVFGVTTLVHTFCSSQQRVELPFTVGNELGETVRLSVGVDARATNRIDTALGEQELPPFHPPQDVFHAVLRFYDTVDGEWKWTYRDFRPLLERDTFSVEHRLLVQRGRGDTVVLRWAYPLPEHVESAVVSDRVTGTLVRIRFDAAQQAIITNEFLEELVLTVWYRFVPSSIVERDVPLSGLFQLVCLYDLMGRLCWQGRRLPPRGLSDLPRGIYIGIGRRPEGRIHRFLWWQP